MTVAQLSGYMQDLYDRYGLYVLGALALGSASWFGYTYYRKHVEQKAFTQFSESLEDYYKLAGAQTAKSGWQDAQAGLAARATSNKHSYLAPYFSALQADAQLKEGDREGALKTLTQVLAALPKEAPLVPLYTIKKALIEIDSADEATRVQGMKNLQALAADDKSPVQDMALYYLGYFAWVAHDIVTAEKEFGKVIMNHKDSVWAKLALSKLEATA